MMKDPCHLIRELASDAGFDLVGICSATEAFEGLEFYRAWLDQGNHGEMGYLARHAELKRSLSNVLHGAKSAIVVGLNYAQPNPVSPGRPHIARYAMGRDYHRIIRNRLARMANQLKHKYPTASFRACTDSAPILERELAHRAGLGWFGKNTMLINSKRGSWFLLGVLLTDAELPFDQPAQGGCGTCNACIEACPTGAIGQLDGRWSVDSRQCLSYWTIENPLERPENMDTSGWHFGCDICQEVCPFNEPRESQPLRAKATDDPDFLPGSQEPTLEEIRAMSEAEWDDWTRGRAIRRAGFDGWKRF